MNFYTPSYHGSYPAAVSPPTSNTQDHPPQRKRHYDAAMHALDQPHPPSLREILGAYRMKGEGDREMLLAILQAKTAEDQRIAAATKLHQSLLQINFAPPDDFSPGGAPLPQRVERPIIHHPKINGGAPSPAVVRPPSSSSAASRHNYAPPQACPPTSTSRHSHPPQERRRQSSSNGWTTAVLSPSPGAESVDEDVIYHQSPVSVKGSSNMVHVHVHGTSASSSSATDSPPGEESAEPPRGGPSGSGDRVMSIGTLLSSHHAAPPTNSSYERRRRRGGNGMDVDDEEEQARRGRKYDER